MPNPAPPPSPSNQCLPNPFPSTWTRPPSPAARRCNCVRVPADARAASWTIDPARRRPSSIRSSELLQIASIFVHGDLQQQEKLHGRRPRASFILPPRWPPSTGPGARRPGPWSPLPKSSSRAPRLRPLWLVGLAAAGERTCSKPAAAKPAALPPSPICCCAREFDAGALHVHGHAAATSSFLCFPPPSLRTLPLSVFRSIRRPPWRKTGAPSSSPAKTVVAAVYAFDPAPPAHAQRARGRTTTRIRHCLKSGRAEPASPMAIGLLFPDSSESVRSVRIRSTTLARLLHGFVLLPSGISGIGNAML